MSQTRREKKFGPLARPEPVWCSYSTKTGDNTVRGPNFFSKTEHKRSARPRAQFYRLINHKEKDFGVAAVITITKAETLDFLTFFRLGIAGNFIRDRHDPYFFDDLGEMHAVTHPKQEIDNIVRTVSFININIDDICV